VDRDQCVLLVVRTGQHQLEFEIGEALGDHGDLGLNFGQRIGVVGFGGEVQQNLGFVDSRLELGPRRDLAAQVRKLLLDRLGGLGVVPESRLRRLLF
jgi:hypothetical protein